MPLATASTGGLRERHNDVAVAIDTGRAAPVLGIYLQLPAARTCSGGPRSGICIGDPKIEELGELRATWIFFLGIYWPGTPVF